MSSKKLTVDGELEELQRESFEYFLHETNPANGLVIDKTAVNWPASSSYWPSPTAKSVTRAMLLSIRKHQFFLPGRASARQQDRHPRRAGACRFALGCRMCVRCDFASPARATGTCDGHPP